jgi:hypothetical protein
MIIEDVIRLIMGTCDDKGHTRMAVLIIGTSDD